MEETIDSSDDDPLDFHHTMLQSPRRARDSAPRPPRKQRKTITQDIVASIVSQINRPIRPTIKQIAHSVGLCDSTVKKFLKKMREGVFDCEDDQVVYIPERKGRKPILDEQDVEAVKTVLTETATATLTSAKERLEENGVSVGKTTIWRTAQKAGLSYQKISYKPAVVFTRRIINERRQYAQRIHECADQEVWFLDESGFNLHIAPLRCWSTSGETPVQAVAPNRGKNISLLMCISSDGIQLQELHEGAFTATEFVVFLQSLAARFPEVLRGEVCLIMDNARIHHAEIVGRYLEENGIRHDYLPPYSPDLNPIENVFGALKRIFRRQGVVQTKALLRRRIVSVINEMNLELDMSRFYRRMREFVQRAMNGESFN